MDIIKIFKELSWFLLSTRRSGTTTLIKKIAEDNDVWVLVPNEKMRKEFGAKSMTFEDLHKIRGFSPKPILLDNFTLIQLSELALDEFKNLDLAIKKRGKLIKTIKEHIIEFERINGQIS